MQTEENIKDEEQELFEHHKFEADAGQALLRVDKFLLDRLPNTTRNKIQTAAKNGNIHANGIPVKSNYKVKPNDVVTIVFPYPIQEIELIPENIPLDIVYEDEDVIVLNKPTNLVGHPGYGNYSGTMVNGFIYHFEHLPVSESNPSSRPGLVHRLDKNTTGLMVVAKTELAMNSLAQQFFERTIERKYYALVWGNIKEDTGCIEGHIGRSVKDRKLRDVFPDGSQGKHAKTHYKVLERLGYVTLVECRLETGRTHQIRVHFKHIGHPLFGDPEYGGDKVLFGVHHAKYKAFVHNGLKILGRQALHAKTLGFLHPSKKENISFNSEISDDFAEVVNRWRCFIRS